MIVSTDPIEIGDERVARVFLAKRFAGGYYLEVILHQVVDPVWYVAVPLDRDQMLRLAADLTACAAELESAKL